MRLDILTLFPDMFTPLKESIIKRATDKNLVEINLIQIRDFSQDAHKKTDDIPYGGGAGMVMTPQPLYDAIQSVKTPNSYVIYLSPRGKVFNQPMARKLSKCEHLILVCGHYEGIDERIIELCIDEEISIGDYVLTGGELPAMVLADSIIRLLDGAISQDSLSEESFTNNLLEYPQYTRPQNFKGLEVPEVLLSGHHSNIAKWRKEKSIEITRKNRPDLLDN
ncbi:MAG: tRNA (guanosine(37)-N1)-methyltransferase TrmD [Eubacteriales bacterium]|nr:tRNA (guanosine(37)-N1)-methyltransferase TrmD [Eubacteriales bacterium]